MKKFDRPVSEDELDEVLDFAYSLATKGEYAQAIALCEWLMQDDATALAARRERASILSHKGDIAEALEDMEQVVQVMSSEPADFHALGILQLQNGATHAAFDSFRRAVDADERANSSYYTSSSLLLAAEAKIRLGEYADALSYAARLPDDYKTYIPGTGMRSKEAVIDQASRELAHVASGRVKFEK